jgi:hypothetical protein
MSDTADIIKIDLNVFLGMYKQVSKDNIPTTLNKKKQQLCEEFKPSFELMNSFQNTTNHYNQHHSGNHNQNQSKYRNNSTTVSKTQANRLYIITSDFTEDSKIKKQFTGYLNKLTDSNKDIVLPKIKELLQNEAIHNIVYDIVWDFIKKQSKNIYNDILEYFDKDITTTYLQEYIDNKQWYPPAYVFDNNLLTSNEELYDMYCEYVKWKKTISNLNKTLCIISNDNINYDRLIEDFFSLIQETIHNINQRHVLHFALEQIQIIMQSSKVNKNKYIDKLNCINVNDLESSCKFLIIDILDGR